MPVKKLEKLLNSSGNKELDQIVQRAQDMGNLAQTLSRGLGDEFAGAIAASNIRDDGTLVIVATSSSWAARLRFESPAIEQIAKNAGHSVSRVKISVAGT